MKFTLMSKSDFNEKVIDICKKLCQVFPDKIVRVAPYRTYDIPFCYAVKEAFDSDEIKKLDSKTSVSIYNNWRGIAVDVVLTTVHRNTTNHQRMRHMVQMRNTLFFNVIDCSLGGPNNHLADVEVILPWGSRPEVDNENAVVTLEEPQPEVTSKAAPAIRKDTTFEELIHEMLIRIESGSWDETPENTELREGLVETPKRVAKAMKHWYQGYGVDIPALLKTFKDGAEGQAGEMVVVKKIPFYSHCEHHMAMIIGHATVAYIPNGRIVGLSKINRLVKALSQRLQVQERLTAQIADTIYNELNALGAAVYIEARHMCVESRGIEQQGHTTVTNALRGNFMDDPTVRAEFMAIARS